MLQKVGSARGGDMYIHGRRGGEEGRKEGEGEGRGVCGFGCLVGSQMLRPGKIF